ncbi:MAG TPA: hypothetical protein VGT04_10810 [Acidobacteriaceae bacterium]|nr:hypothetical protein [Acidobacteriaceae bacterium]
MAKVNGAIALICWPFALYEALGKKAASLEIKARLDLKCDQVLNSITLNIEEAILPHWPRRISRVILEPHYDSELPSALSDAARDAITQCLSDCGHQYMRTVRMSRLTRRIFTCDKVFYWLIFTTALLAFLMLCLWFFVPDMPIRLAEAALIIPIAAAVAALVVAGTRQAFIQNAEKEIIDDQENA